MWNVDTICRISDLVASMVHFDRFHCCLLFRNVVFALLAVSYTRADVCINAYSLKKYCSSFLLICIVIDHGVNIPAKQ